MPRQSIRIERTCQQCGAAFAVKPSALKYGSADFCCHDCYHAARKGKSPFGESPEAAFWSKVDRSGGPDACWIWTGAPGGWGYGRMMINGERKPSHRIAWELTNGQIPHDMLVCHHCDTPLCCNPAHLFLGTDADNNADKMAKGRGNTCRGEKTGTSKLTAEQVLEIRARYRPYEVMQADLAAEFGVSVGCIESVVNRKSWRHL